MPEILTPMPAQFRLRELLEEAGIKQTLFARDAGLSFATINRLCTNATAQVSLATVDKILAALAAAGSPATVSDLIEWLPARKRGRG